jgi:hypothetical protein
VGKKLSNYVWNLLLSTTLKASGATIAGFKNRKKAKPPTAACNDSGNLSITCVTSIVQIFLNGLNIYVRKNQEKNQEILQRKL